MKIAIRTGDNKHHLPYPYKLTKFYGGHSKEDPPVPIPNTEVKLFSANGTARATVWESRSPPFFIKQKPQADSLPGAFVVSATLNLS